MVKLIISKAICNSGLLNWQMYLNDTKSSLNHSKLYKCPMFSKSMFPQLCLSLPEGISINIPILSHDLTITHPTLHGEDGKCPAKLTLPMINGYYLLVSSNMASWKITISMEVSSQENHQTKWSIFQHAMFDDTGGKVLIGSCYWWVVKKKAMIKHRIQSCFQFQTEYGLFQTTKLNNLPRSINIQYLWGSPNFGGESTAM